MKSSFIRALAFFGIFALAACQSGGMVNAVPANGGAAGTSNVVEGVPLMAGDGEIPLAGPNAVRQVCPRPSQPGEMQCFSMERVDLRSNGMRPNSVPYGYGPDDLKSAYGILGGRSSLVAIVAAYGYPGASNDLAKYRSTYQLAACTVANSCLKIRNQTGGTNLPPPNANWDAEQAVDLDMVSAMCGACKILLIQANDNKETNLYTAVGEAVKLGAAVVSNSYGISEYNQCQGGGQASNPIFSTAHHVYVASSGDFGGGLLDCGGPQQPCSFATVVCAGGTYLVRSHAARGWTETVWNELSSQLCGSGGCGAAGSGCSTVVKKPAWQFDTLCKMRSESDVSAEASVLTPVAVYFSGDGGWTAFGGTSVSAPLLAGIFGRAGNAGTISGGPQNLWAHRSSLWDVSVGNNLDARLTGNCASSVRYICYARKGFDGPTGLGTPHGLGAF